MIFLSRKQRIAVVCLSGTLAFSIILLGSSCEQFIGKSLPPGMFVDETPTRLSSKSPKLPISYKADFVVPNVVHYVWIADQKSMKSAYMNLKPDKIRFHCTHLPTGKWWKLLERSVNNLNLVKLKALTRIFGKSLLFPKHQSDIARIEILIKQGGIYLDMDVIILKSFDPLRTHNMTKGLEYEGSPGRLNNGVIVAREGARFLSLWYGTYRNFTSHEWDYHCCIIPYYMQYKYPDLIHVEKNTINWPSGRNLRLIYEEIYDWSDNYAMHLWHRLHKQHRNPEDIKGMNTTFGQIARFIFYKSPELIL